MDNRLRIGVIGDNTIDEYIGAETRRLIGGNALNVAVQLARLGHHVQLASAIGPDADGEEIRLALRTNQVDTSALVVLHGHTSISRIQVMADGDRVFEDEDFAVCDDYRPTADVLNRLSSCDVVHIGMLRDAGPVRAQLRSAGVPVSQDCAVTPGYSDLAVAFLSAGEAPKEARAMAEQAIAGGARLAIVTCGAAGSHGYDGTNWWYQPAEPIDPLDTTGAGDSYIAGFLAEYAAGAPVDQAMRAGARLAARTCTHVGGWPQSSENAPDTPPIKELKIV